MRGRRARTNSNVLRSVRNREMSMGAGAAVTEEAAAGTFVVEPLEWALCANGVAVAGARSQSAVGNRARSGESGCGASVAGDGDSTRGGANAEGTYAGSTMDGDAGTMRGDCGADDGTSVDDASTGAAGGIDMDVGSTEGTAGDNRGEAELTREEAPEVVEAAGTEVEERRPRGRGMIRSLEPPRRVH